MTDIKEVFREIKSLAEVGENLPTNANLRRIRTKCDDVLAADEMMLAPNGLKYEENAWLETTGDLMEGIARNLPKDHPFRGPLFETAWELKQIARSGTPSQGI